MGYVLSKHTKTKTKKHALVLFHADNGERGYSYVLKSPCIPHNILFILGTSQMDG